MSSNKEPRQVGARGATCRKTDGTPCPNYPKRGTHPPVCSAHLLNPKARANAAVRAEVEAWRFDDETADPGQVLLRLLTQAANRAALYGLLLEQQYQQADDGADASELPAGVRALIGHRHTVSEGRLFPVAEAIRGLVELEGQERDRAARYAKLALDAGIAERLVRVEETKAQVIVQVLRASLAELGVAVTDQRVGEVVVRQLRAIEAGA